MTRSMLRTLVRTVALGAVLAQGTIAAAQPAEAPTAPPSYHYEFLDELVAGSSLGTQGLKIHGDHPILRTQLIRPRTQFVDRLLVSVVKL